MYSWVARVVAGLIPAKKLRILKPAGFDRQKSRVESELHVPLVQVSTKSVRRNPVKIGPEVGHFSQYQQYINTRVIFNLN